MILEAYFRLLSLLNPFLPLFYFGANRPRKFVSHGLISRGIGNLITALEEVNFEQESQQTGKQPEEQSEEQPEKQPERDPNEQQKLWEMIADYLSKKSPTFKELMVLKRKGWENREGDTYFQEQRNRADNAGRKQQNMFYSQMQQIAQELEKDTGALRLQLAEPRVLDICMASGGFSEKTLEYNRAAWISGITLPPKDGGHKVLLNMSSDKIAVYYLDITMLADEFGLMKEDIPADHPDKDNFIFDGLRSLGSPFDLVFCDGQVLRTHARHEYREHKEATRLTCSQLIIAFQRIKTGGTLVMLLHKIEAWDTLQLLHILSQCSDIQLFKPARKHTTRSSFYLVAKNVQPQSSAALAAVGEWKATWKLATFPSEEVSGQNNGESAGLAVIHEVEATLAKFGDKLVELGDPIWEIQRAALMKAPYIQ